MSCEGALGSAAVGLGIFTLAGLLVPNVGALGGVALGGFTGLLIVPICAAGACVGGALGAAGSCGNKTATTAMAVVAAVCAVLITLYCSQLICSKFDTLPPFTYIDALKVFGHSLWMTLALGILGYGCKQECC